MKILVALLGAQNDAILRAVELGRRLRQRGHSLTFLGEFHPGIVRELQDLDITVTNKVDNEVFGAMVIGSLAAPDRFANLAQRLPSLLLVQQSTYDMMSMRGDFAHWISLFRSVRGIVFMTEIQRDKTFSSYVTGIDPAQIYVAPCGPPAESFLPFARQERDYLSVVMSGDITPYMRQQDLIAAGERLRDFKVIFNFIGKPDAKNALPEGIQKIVERHPERYLFLGSKTQSEIINIFRQSDLYCHTAIDEAWSSPVITAAAMGLPLMLSDIDAFASPWKNGVNCLKFPINSPDFLASSMRMVIQDDVLRANLAASAKKTAQRYSGDLYYQQVIRLIEGIGK